MEIAIITTMVAPILSHASTTMKTLIKFYLHQAWLEIRCLFGFRLPNLLLLICLEQKNPDTLLLLLVKLEAIKLFGTIDLMLLKTLGFLCTITGITTAKTKSMEKIPSTLKTMELSPELRMELMSTSAILMSVKRLKMIRSRLRIWPKKLKKRKRQLTPKLLS